MKFLTLYFPHPLSYVFFNELTIFLQNDTTLCVEHLELDSGTVHGSYNHYDRLPSGFKLQGDHSQLLHHQLRDGRRRGLLHHIVINLKSKPTKRHYFHSFNNMYVPSLTHIYGPK